MTRRIYVKPRPPAEVEEPAKPTVDTSALDAILAVARQRASDSVRIDTQGSTVTGRSIVDSDTVPITPRHRLYVDYSPSDTSSRASTFRDIPVPGALAGVVGQIDLRVDSIRSYDNAMLRCIAYRISGQLNGRRISAETRLSYGEVEDSRELPLAGVAERLLDALMAEVQACLSAMIITHIAEHITNRGRLR